ncbi:hypothetical protein ABZQ63_15260, partial [Pseudomonas aeruginosa]
HFHTDHPVFSCSIIEQKQLNTWVSFQSAEQPLLGQFSVSGNTVFAAVGLGIDIPSLAHSGGTRNVVAQVKTVVRSWQIGADTGVHFMVTIGLLVPVHEILDHVSCLALCSIEKAPTPQGLW